MRETYFCACCGSYSSRLLAIDASVRVFFVATACAPISVIRSQKLSCYVDSLANIVLLALTAPITQLLATITYMQFVVQTNAKTQTAASDAANVL